MKTSRLVIVLILLALPTVLYARWIEDKAVFQTQAVGPVEFSHFNHLEAVGKNCPTCHNSIFNIDVKKNPTFTMAEMEKGKSCGACHNGTRAFSVTEDCSACHPTREITFAVPDVGPVAFSHEVHTSMFGCQECHPDIYIPQAGKNGATMTEMENGQSCGACHDDGTAFTVADNCDTCHQIRRARTRSRHRHPDLARHTLMVATKQIALTIILFLNSFR